MATRKSVSQCLYVLLHSISLQREGGFAVGRGFTNASVGYSVANLHKVLVSVAQQTLKPAPIKQNFDFKGWYMESTCINEWNFDADIVSQDITLRAKWTQGNGIDAVQTNTLAIYPNPATDIDNCKL